MFEVPEEVTTRKAARVSSAYQSSLFEGDMRTIPAVAERIRRNLGGSDVLPPHETTFVLKSCGGSTSRPEFAFE